MKFEYIRLYFDFGDLSGLNSLGSNGWRVVTVTLDGGDRRQGRQYVALLERSIA